MDNRSTLKSWIAESSRIVFFGGAGVSTESGIPDFRSVDGLYHQKFDYPPETILSHGFFFSHTAEFYRFYREKMLVTDIAPNRAHLALAELERQGRLAAVVTQNIDGLHQKAGSQTVYELHGSIHRNHCQRCGRFFSAQELMALCEVPRCPCGGLIKPDVVLYEEALDEETVTGAVEAIARADLLIVGGTSLTVYPAAGLLRYYRGHRLVLINRDETPYDSQADLVFHEKLGDVLEQVVPMEGNHAQ